jgi:SAM-dependent methyltransferase
VEDRVLLVVADITQLPIADDTFGSATTAETLEHIADHERAVAELARVLDTGGALVGTVPAGPRQWSEWDEWAGHLRRYTRREMLQLLEGAGLEAEATTWGWPMLRIYDEQFLRRVNRRRLHSGRAVDDDPALATVSRLGRRRHLVRLVRSVFALDRVFDGAPWGVGLLFSGRKTTT